MSALGAAKCAATRLGFRRPAAQEREDNWRNCSQVHGAGHAILHGWDAHLLQGGRLARRGGLGYVAYASRRQQLIALHASISTGESDPGGHLSERVDRAGRAAVRSTHVGVLLEQHAVAVRAAAVLPGEPREVVLAFGAAVWEPRPKTPAQKKKSWRVAAKERGCDDAG